MAARNQLLAAARKNPLLAQVRQNGLDDTPQLHLDVDQAKANALGISVADINATLSAAWGGSYINDFIDRGRVKRVYMQGDAPFRMAPEDLERWYVRSRSGTMAPFSSFMNVALATGTRAARTLQRPARRSTFRDRARRASAPAPRWTKWSSSSQSCRKASGSNGPARRIRNACPARRHRRCTRFRCSSCSCASRRCTKAGRCRSRCCSSCRSASSAPCSRPRCAASYNDIYFQVGLLATMGLAAKNAILIVEFAEAELRAGCRRDRSRAARVAAAPAADPDDVASRSSPACFRWSSRPAPAPRARTTSAPAWSAA